MAIVDYPNLTECLTDDGFPDRPDGWFLKYVDTGITYHRVAGAWVEWGLGLSFAPPTKSGSVITDNTGMAEIVFGTPFYDNAYTVALTCSDEGEAPPVALLIARNRHGFSFKTVSSRSGLPMRDVTVSWLATRNYNK